MLDEQVRGSVPDPSLFSLTGLEQIRAFTRGLMPSTPSTHLLGYRVTQVSSGTAVLTQRVSPWFEVYEGFVELVMVAESAVYTAALTVAPPATSVRTVNLSLRYLRPCTVENEAVIARGRVLHAGSSFTTVEALIEDTLGRAVAHATGSAVMSAMDPPPPPRSRDLNPVEEPVYSGPDPPARPVPRARRELENGALLPRLAEFLGAEVQELDDGRWSATVPASEWFARLTREVSPGILAALASACGAITYAAQTSPEKRFATVNTTLAFLAPVLADGRRLVATTGIRDHRERVWVGEFKVSDDAGRTVMLGQPTFLATSPAARATATDRVLLSVLFTDLVDSTAQARRLGDARWNELLEEHHALVRRQLQLHRGHEVKTMGDGFLATFDSPTRAARCALAIRESVRRLELEVRAGIHTGECEVSGADVAGLAVNVAARVQSAAEPGEILVSRTVHDLVAGSGLAFSDRGERALKGLDGAWQLYRLDG